MRQLSAAGCQCQERNRNGSGEMPEVIRTSETSCWALGEWGKVGCPEHHTSCTLLWIVRADRKAGDRRRLWTAARSASTPPPTPPPPPPPPPPLFSCCATRCSAAVTSAIPNRDQTNNNQYISRCIHHPEGTGSCHPADVKALVKALVNEQFANNMIQSG